MLLSINAFNPSSAKVQSESGFAAPYHFSISPTCGFGCFCFDYQKVGEKR